MPRRTPRTLLVCGGIYGNLQALQALLQRADALHIPRERIILTGDIAAYCADGAACAALCRRELADALIIRGNCERTLAADEADCGCGFAEDSLCNLLSAAWHAHAARTVPTEDKAWFATLPPRAHIEFGGRRIAVIHGGSEADNTFIFASTPDKARHLAALDADGVIAGHCGIPFTEAVAGANGGGGGGGVWHNSGALGMPANDGTSRTWYSLWHDTPQGIVIEHCALQYDHAAAAAAMDAAALPPDYRDTLASGIWPSDSVLPAAEKAQQGRALAPAPVLWRAENNGASCIMPLADSGSVAQLVRAHA